MMDGTYRTNEARANSERVEPRKLGGERGADPYAPPKMHKDKSGGLVRGAVMAVLVGGAALGYYLYDKNTPDAPPLGTAQQEGTALEDYAATPAPGVGVNEIGAPASDYTPPPGSEPATLEPTAAPQAAPAPAARRAAPAASAAQPTPAPVVESTPAPVLSTPAPSAVPPLDQPTGEPQ